MDGSQDWLDSEILEAGKCLLGLFRNKLCPAYVREQDMIMYAAPWEEADFRVGVYLYDIQDYSVMMTSEGALTDTERRFPPKAVELSYMVFCNETHRFGGIQREQIQVMLNEIVRVVYDNPMLEQGNGEMLQIAFLRENMDFKIRLWGSFSKPLQPAVYIKAAPLLIRSERKRRVSNVQERDYHVVPGNS